MGADEEGTLAALKALRRELVDPIIAQHTGRIVKTMGDGILVEFLRMTPDLMAGKSEEVQIVTKAQLELAARGYYLGTADGRIGAFAQRALVAFQRDEGVMETGELDVATIAKLGIAPK